MIKQENIDRIISDVSIRDVAIDEGITFSKERGGKLWACCPFHNENTPSFSLIQVPTHGSAMVDAIAVEM